MRHLTARRENANAPEKNLGPQDPLIALANRLRRLSPSHRDPERFHLEKSEIEGELRRLARTGPSRIKV